LEGSVLNPHQYGSTIFASLVLIAVGVSWALHDAAALRLQWEIATFPSCTGTIQDSYWKQGIKNSRRYILKYYYQVD
jgi:hypothetical protein